MQIINIEISEVSHIVHFFRVGLCY